VRVHVTRAAVFENHGIHFDVIIVNLPDPQTAQLNRFYTLEFFQEAARKLTGSGVLALRLTRRRDYISPELAAFLGSIHKTCTLCFPRSRRFPARPFTSSRRGGPAFWRPAPRSCWRGCGRGTWQPAT